MFSCGCGVSDHICCASCLLFGVLSRYSVHCRGGRHNSSVIHIKGYCSIIHSQYNEFDVKKIVKVCNNKTEEYTSGATKWFWKFKWSMGKKKQSDK